jgi:hypothetical protein
MRDRFERFFFYGKYFPTLLKMEEHLADIFYVRYITTRSRGYGIKDYNGKSVCAIALYKRISNDKNCAI